MEQNISRIFIIENAILGLRQQYEEIVFIFVFAYYFIPYVTADRGLFESALYSSSMVAFSQITHFNILKLLKPSGVCHFCKELFVLHTLLQCDIYGPFTSGCTIWQV